MHSATAPCQHDYFISGTFTNGVYERMVPDDLNPGLFTYNGTMCYECQELFHIAVDGQQQLAFFPEAQTCYPGESIVKGPQALPDGRNFSIFCLKQNAAFQIIFNRAAVDRRKVVEVKWLDGRADAD